MSVATSPRRSSISTGGSAESCSGPAIRATTKPGGFTTASSTSGPALIARCRGVADVMDAVAFAQSARPWAVGVGRVEDAAD